jgi:hypothetical protein
LQHLVTGVADVFLNLTLFPSPLPDCRTLAHRHSGSS